MIVRPAKSIHGEIRLPGDKSISHRAAIIGSMAEGESRIGNFATGEDCASTLRCLRQLGVRIKQEGTTVYIGGVGKQGFTPPDGPLDCGNSGTTMRLLAGLLAGQKFESILTGDESLRKRPMKRVIEPLRQMGADVIADGRPPLTIRAVERMEGIEYEIPVASAQVKSCLLLAGLNAVGEMTVRESIATRDHTERMLRGFGVNVQFGNAGGEKLITVSSDSVLFGRDVDIPGDISAAAFFLVAAACLDGSKLVIKDLGINPTRTAVLDLLMERGTEIGLTDEKLSIGESSATAAVRGATFVDRPGLRIKGEKTAELIDELPILAVLGTQLEKGLEVRDAAELRVKETDRIAAIGENLRRMNADVEEFDDGFRVGRSDLTGAVIDPFGDHRIAMAFTVAGLLAQGDTTIKHPECVDISFPGFYEILESVVNR